MASWRRRRPAAVRYGPRQEFRASMLCRKARHVGAWFPPKFRASFSPRSALDGNHVTPGDAFHPLCRTRRRVRLALAIGVIFVAAKRTALTAFGDRVCR